MKSSKAQIHSRVHSIPGILFDDQRLTSCSGLVIFQALFQALGLKRRLQRCFKHLGRKGVYGIHTIFMILVVHILIGHRRLRELAYYKDDPMVRLHNKISSSISQQLRARARITSHFRRSRTPRTSLRLLGVTRLHRRRRASSATPGPRPKWEVILSRTLRHQELAAALQRW